MPYLPLTAKTPTSYAMFSKLQKKIIDNPLFRAWFANSKITNKDGSPKTMYHGSPIMFRGASDANWSFDISKIGTGSKHGSAGLGFFFSQDKATAKSYAQGGEVAAVYMKIENPYEMSLKEAQSFVTVKDSLHRRAELKRQGHDGVIVDVGAAGHEYHIVFNPNQIKSATDNTGQFSSGTGDIRYSKADKPAARKTPRTLDEILYTPEQLAAMYPGPDPTALTGGTSRAQDIADKYGMGDLAARALTYWVDKDAPISRVQKSLPNQPENLDYSLRKRLLGKVVADETEVVAETVLKPARKQLVDNDIAYDDVGLLAWAEHVPERNLKMKRDNARDYVDKVISTMTEPEATEYKERLAEIKEQSIPVTEKRDGYISILSDMEKTLGERAKNTKGNTESRVAQQTEIFSKWNDVKDRLSGMTNAEAKKVIEHFKAKGNYKEIQKAVGTLREIGADALKMNLDSGELTQEEYDNISGAYKYHVPLFREDVPNSGFGKSATGSPSVGPLASPIKSAVGSTKRVISGEVYAHVVDRYQSAISRKHKLEAGKVLYDMVLANPSDMWSIEKTESTKVKDNEGNVRWRHTDPRTVDSETQAPLKVNGELFVLEVADTPAMKRFMESLKDSPSDLGPILRASQKVNRFLAMLNTTLSPEFMITNFGRDIQTAGIHMEDTEAKGMQKKVLANVGPAIKAIFNIERGEDGGRLGGVYVGFKKHGAKISWMQGYENVEELAKNLESELAYEAGKRPKREKFRKLLSFVGAMNTAVENGVRLATYDQLIKAGVSPRKAAYTASNLTVDFTRHGTAGPKINALWMFANAGIQGNARMIKAIHRNPKIRKITAGITAFGFTANIIGAMMGGDDDDGESFYDKLRFERPSMFERNMIFMIPNSGGRYIKIPMPYGYALFFVAGNEAASAMRNPPRYDNIEGMGRVMNTFLNTFNPIGAGTILQTISPTVTDPIVQSKENKAWHGGDLMPGENPFGGAEKPDSERYWKSVNPIAKSVTAWVNDHTFGSAVKPGILDVSPETIENMVENYTGSLGRFVKDVAMLPVKAVGEEGLTARDIPFTRKIIGGKSDYVDNKIYRSNLERVQVYKRELAAGIVKRDPDMSRVIGYSKSTQTQLRGMKKRLTRFEDKKNTIRAKEVKDQIRKVQRRYNTRFNKVVYGETDNQ
jgi:hypothetical protein